MTNYALASRTKSVLDQWDGARPEFTPVDPQRDIFTAIPVNSNLHIRDLRIRQHQHEKHYASGSAISHKDNYTYHQPKECTEITHARLATIFTSGSRCKGHKHVSILHLGIIFQKELWRQTVNGFEENTVSIYTHSCCT